MPDYPLFKLCSNLYKVVPSVLVKTGKVRRQCMARMGRVRKTRMHGQHFALQRHRVEPSACL